MTTTRPVTTRQRHNEASPAGCKPGGVLPDA
jgi:hypothetical protein